MAENAHLPDSAKTVADRQVKILLVDDQPANLLALEATLAGLGHHLVKAHSGEDALRCCLQDDFAVILLDVQMAGMDGFETANMIRGRERSQRTPIVFLTAHQSNRLSAEEAYSLGAVDYLVKPVLPVVLRAKVRGFVKLFEQAEQVKNQAERIRELERHEFEQALADQRRHAEEELRESEQRFTRQLADALPQIVWTARPDGFVEYFNERWYEFTGFERGNFGDQSWKPILHPEDVQRCVDTYYGCVQSGRLYQIEYRFKDRKTGGYRWFLGRAYPVRDDQNRIVRWIGTCTDIDDTKKAEESLKEADRRKDEFLAMLAHELRNPLAPVRTALQIMKMSAADSQAVREARDVMDRQVQHLVRLVDDLMDVSRIMRNRIELRKERLELITVFTRAVETAQPVIDAQGHQLTVSLPAHPILLEGDLVRLAQVVGNLLVNAAKYTDAAGRIALIGEAHNGEVIIRIQDSGVGIDPQLLPVIFDLFVQSDRSLARSRGGLGIGLTVVKHLVEMHGGSVSVTSAGTGQGSEFIVRLPALPMAAAVDCNRAVMQELRPSNISLRVLVVDDNVDAAESAAMLLRLLKHDVMTAHDGQGALEAVKIFRPDIVLLDIGLPGMSGYDVAKTLRAQPDYRHLVLVAVTGYGQEEDRRQSDAAGFDQHLVKPVDPATLVSILAGVERSPRSGETP